MTYIKAVTVSLALALGWIMGNPAVALGPRPAPDPQAEVQMNVARVESLTQHLRSNPEDASAIEDPAALYRTNGAYDAAIGPLVMYSAARSSIALYMTNGAYDAAIGPLARALEL